MQNKIAKCSNTNKRTSILIIIIIYIYTIIANGNIKTKKKGFFPQFSISSSRFGINYESIVI
jgi:hypothetical protein